MEMECGGSMHRGRVTISRSLPPVKSRFSRGCYRAAVRSGVAPVREPAIKPVRAGTLWVLLYLALIVTPLLVLLPAAPRGGGFPWDFSLALGYAALAMFGVQFWLTARFKRASAPFGIDLIYYFHRYLASIAFLLLLVHVAIMLLRYPAAVGRIDPRLAPAYMTLAWLGLLAFALLIASSLWRKQLGIEYDRWRLWHVVLAVLGVGFAVLHVQGSGSYLDTPWTRIAWTLLAVSWLGLAIRVRLIRPLQLRRRPYRISALRQQPGRSWTLSLEPHRPPRLDYRPGQFAWLSLRASPFALREHPFSFSSSPTRAGPLEFTIKELGDFTATIGTLQPGETVYVDGPYGSFGVDFHPHAAGCVFVAGGAGIAPIISMLRALADRGDRRPLWLFYGNRRLDRVVFDAELQDLATRLDLTLVLVLTEPPADWHGETGYITAELMARHLPADRAHLRCFVCGPDPMIRLVEHNLRTLGIPLRHLHTEIFDLA
jgi:predicted ferric reductase